MTTTEWTSFCLTYQPMIDTIDKDLGEQKDSIFAYLQTFDSDQALKELQNIFKSLMMGLIPAALEMGMAKSKLMTLPLIKKFKVAEAEMEADVAMAVLPAKMTSLYIDRAFKQQQTDAYTNSFTRRR